MDLIKNSFLEAQQVLEAFISDEKNLGQVKNAGDLLVDMFRQGGKVFSCGNGGSLCDAMHFAEELTGRFRHERAALPAIAIADPSHFTCVSSKERTSSNNNNPFLLINRPTDIIVTTSSFLFSIIKFENLSFSGTSGKIDPVFNLTKVSRLQAYTL